MLSNCPCIFAAGIGETETSVSIVCVLGEIRAKELTNESQNYYRLNQITWLYTLNCVACWYPVACMRSGVWHFRFAILQFIS
jgi:hypothetical protein